MAPDFTFGTRASKEERLVHTEPPDIFVVKMIYPCVFLCEHVRSLISLSKSNNPSIIDFPGRRKGAL